MNRTQELINDFSDLIPETNYEYKSSMLDRLIMGEKRRALILKSLGQNTRFEIYERKFEARKRTHANIYVKVGEPEKDLPMIEAHYDIANPDSENMQDNTASVINLLCLADNRSFNGWIAFTDNEELVHLGDSGIRRLVEDIRRNAFFKGNPPTSIISLELTGRGQELWGDAISINTPNITNKICPLNNAVFARELGIRATCLGTLPKENLFNPNPIWSICHSVKDNRHGISVTDMVVFQNKLKTLQKEIGKAIKPLVIRPMENFEQDGFMDKFLDVLFQIPPKFCIKDKKDNNTQER